MTAPELSPRKEHFFERLNADGTHDLLCLNCRALAGENLAPENLPVARLAHSCRQWRSSFGFRRAAPWNSGSVSIQKVSGEN
jgi:hypothetical protein